MVFYIFIYLFSYLSSANSRNCKLTSLNNPVWDREDTAQEQEELKSNGEGPTFVWKQCFLQLYNI